MRLAMSAELHAKQNRECTLIDANYCYRIRYTADGLISVHSRLFVVNRHAKCKTANAR